MNDEGNANDRVTERAKIMGASRGQSFDQEMNRWQSAWRESHVTAHEWGTQNGKRYPWILPRRHWREGLWPGIRPGSNPDLERYLDRESIQKHQGVHNLKSSWMLCANLYFAHSSDTETLARFLGRFVDARIVGVDTVELEWTEKGSLAPARLLGEPGGRRGAGQTSPDVAFLVELAGGRRGIVLTEVKFTEHSFYTCPGRTRENGNRNPERCLSARTVLDRPAEECHLVSWARGRRRNRRYWDHLSFTEEAKDRLRTCPAARGGYQLLRQQALAEGIAEAKYDLVISAVAYDARNEALLASMKAAGVSDFTEDWGGLFRGKARFASFSHQEWVRWVRANDRDGRRRDWLAWASARYGY